MRVRIRWKQLGGHIHMRVFVGPEETLAKAGDLVVREDEWEPFRAKFTTTVEWVKEQP